MTDTPENLRYSAEHEWIDADSRIGVTRFAVDELGDVVYVDLPEVGAGLTAGEVIGEIESTKSVSDLYSPVTGTVTEVNAAAIDDPAIITRDPYGDGWLFRVEVEAEGELLSAAEYAAAQEE